MRVRSITKEELAALPAQSASTGNSHLIITPFQTHDIRELSGFVTEEDGRLSGAVTFALDEPRCEIVTIDAFEKRRGVGTMLVNAVREHAAARGCDRVELFTTNDNHGGQAFYEALGFRIRAFFPDGMELVRKVKPGIPYRGLEGRPLRDMIQYELRID